MEIAKVLAAGISGTTAMTAFSYVLSEAKEKNFKEPLLLANMIRSLMPHLHKENAYKAGWAVHYSVGIFFALVYKYILQKNRKTGSVKKGTIMGGLTGLAAVAIWQMTFRLHPNPPKTHYNRFYGQLVVAHIIFGVVTISLLDDRTCAGQKTNTLN